MTGLQPGQGYLPRLATIGLRGMTLCSKFLLMIVLAKQLEPSVVGLYGLVVATVGYAIYPLGFEFYTYNTRELLRHQQSEWGGLLKNQAFLHLALYILILPLLALIFYFELLPLKIIFWFYAVLIVEHVNQEIIRVLIALSEQLSAAIILFTLQGVWALVLSLGMFFIPEFRNLESILIFWFFGGFIALLFSTYKIKMIKAGGWSSAIDFEWIRKGLYIAIPFLCSTLALTGVYTLDRYWFEWLVGLEILGVYVLFMGITSALISFMEAGIFSFKYPSMISSFNAGLSHSFRKHTESMLVQVILFLALYVVLAHFFLRPVLGLIGKEIYFEHIDLFYWIFVVKGLQAINSVPHYALYSQGKDYAIIASHVTSLGLFVPVVIFLSSFSSIYAVPTALCVVQIVILVWKGVCYYNQTPREYRIYKI